VSWKGVEGITSYGITSYEMSFNNRNLFSGELTEGQIHSATDIRISNTGKAFTLTASNEELQKANVIIYYIRTFYFRAIGYEASLSTLQEILDAHEGRLQEAHTTSNTAYETTITSMKTHI
jgi:hypothetical protein